MEYDPNMSPQYAGLGPGVCFFFFDFEVYKMSVKVVIICDSRGRHLQEYPSNHSIRVLFYSGAVLQGVLYVFHMPVVWS